MTDIYRQGDVLLIPVDCLPDGRKVRRKGGKLILAEGEATGHHHAIAESRCELVETQAHDIYLRVMGEAPALLTHQEHASIEVPPGVYKVTRQREYVPRALPRNVAD